jgi:hypothetical protein
MRWCRVFLLLLGLCLWCWVPQSVAQQTCRSEGKGFRAIDFQEFTVTNTVPVSIDMAKLPAQGTTDIAMAYISVEDATIRFRFAGVPSQTSGHEIAAGASTVLCGRSVIETFRAIRTSSGSGNAIVRITLFDTYY